MDEREARILEIHQAAFSKLHDPDKRLPTRRLFDELKGLQSSVPSKEWLEAAILMGVFRLARPMKTMFFLDQLREMAKASNETERFEKFHSAVTEYLSPLRLANHGYVDNSFGTTSHEDIWVGLESHMKTLKDAGHKVFLDSGILLGLIRDGKPIDHDNDIDLGLILDATSEDEAVLEWEKMPQKLRDLGIFSEGPDQHPAMLRLTPIAGYQVDLFPAWFSKNKVIVYPHTFGKLKPKDVYPFATCKITGLDQPAEPEKMLAVNYGEGWKTPDPLFRFVRPKEFDGFLSKIAARENR